MGKALYIGEYGASNDGTNDGYNATGSQGYLYTMASIGTIVQLQVPLSTLWAWECPSHEDTPNWCLHPGKPSHQNSTFVFAEQLRLANLRLQQGPAAVFNRSMTRILLPQSPQGPACLDGSPYALWYRLGSNRSKWVVNMQGKYLSYTVLSCHTLCCPAILSCVALHYAILKGICRWWVEPNTVPHLPAQPHLSGLVQEFAALLCQ